MPEHPFEVWASPEATVARVDSGTVRDQVRETGHYGRDGDVELLAALGVRATRYPVVWEHVSPDAPAIRDFRWQDRRLDALRSRGIEPVVTLLHHGSGPRYTELTDPAFPNLFADFAGAAARAFPWVRRWTPINEATTTARFATLYGHWYPNGCMDHRAFGTALVNEALATVLGMQAIRHHAHGAELVVTEDLQGFTAGNAGARRYVEHKRQRSVLFIDLITGRVRPGHALWRYLREDCGVPRATLDRVRANGLEPSLLGFNYYTNSERYVARNPDGTWFNVPLIDVEGPPLDPKPLAKSIFERFRLPIGFTEIHLCGTEEERVAWLEERVQDALALHRDGVDFRVVAPWAAFGMIDWRSVLSRKEGIREDGIYTCARIGEQPQHTAVTDAVVALAGGTLPTSTLRDRWWHDEGRRIDARALIGGTGRAA